MGTFKLKKKTNLKDTKIGDEFSESDYAIATTDDHFLQFEYLSEDKKELTPYDVEPGVWAIGKDISGLFLYKTSFVKDEVLDSLVKDNTLVEKVNLFFDRLHIYKKHGIEIPKRAALLYGPAGSGKSTTLNKVLEFYQNDHKTAVVVWHTDKYEAHTVKDFIKRFAYKGVERLIMVLEDLGGVEVNDRRIPSESSLLSILDNNEKTFTIPVFLMATTNHPESFLGNLTNRPGRFDDKIEVGFLSSENRSALLTFFAKETITREAAELIKTEKFKSFTPAHIREAVIRSDLYDQTLDETLKAMLRELEKYNKEFSSNGGSMGILREDD
jgi:hypothetical protein